MPELKGDIVGQDPKDLTNVTCDICGHSINPKEKFIRLRTETLWSQSGVGLGVFVCKKCVIEKLDVNPDAFGG